MPVIDVHTHMFGPGWKAMYLKHGGAGNTIKRRGSGQGYRTVNGKPDLTMPPSYCQTLVTQVSGGAFGYRPIRVGIVERLGRLSDIDNNLTSVDPRASEQPFASRHVGQLRVLDPYSLSHPFLQHRD